MDPQGTEAKKSFLDKFGPLVLTAFVFLLPLFVIPSAIFPFQAGKILLVSIFSFLIFAFWLITKLRYGSVSIPWSPVLGLSLLLFAVYLVSSIFSSSFMSSLIGRGLEIDTVLSIFSFVVLMFMVPQLLRTKQSIFNLYFALLVSFFVLFLFSFIRVVAGPEVFTLNILSGSAANLVGSWNDFSIFFGLITILSLIMLEIVPPKGVLKAILYGALVLSLASLSVANFGTVWLVVSLFAIALFVYSFAFSRAFGSSEEEGGSWKSIWRVPKATIIVFAVALIFVITGSGFVSSKYPSLDIGTKIAEGLNITQLEARPSWGTTLDIAGKTLSESPLIGAGPNRFVVEWLKYRPVVVNESAFWNIDFNYGIGIIPSSLVTVGILGFAAWVLFIGFFVYLGIKSLRRPREDLFSYYLSVTSFVGALYLWIMAVLYTTSTVPFALAFVMTGVFVASLVAQGSIREKTLTFTEEPAMRFVAFLLIIILFISSLVSLFFFSQRNVSLAYFNSGLRTFNTTGNLEASEIKVRRAIGIYGGDTYYRGLSEIALLNLNRVAQEVTPDTPPEQIRNQFQVLLGGAIASAQAARDVDQDNYQNWISLGRTYESVVPLQIPGAYENAKAAYEEAVKRNPTSPSVRLVLARLELLKNDNDSARVYIEEALSLKRNYTEAVFLLSQIEVAEGNIRGAIQSVESAAILSPNDPTVFFQLGFLHYNNRDYDKAIAALERAVALEPSYANARYFLGLSYDAEDRKGDAITQFEQIERTNPSNEEVKFILSNLRAGRDAFSNVEAPLDDEPEKRDELPIDEDEESEEI